MYQLSVCAETVFRDLPFPRRVVEIARAGFLVEFWGRGGSDIDAIEREIENEPQIRISSMVGSAQGSIMHPEHVDSFLEGVRTRLLIAERLHCRQLILLVSELNSRAEPVYPISYHPATTWITAYEALCRVAELAEKHNVSYNLENLNNKVDHPGYPLQRVEDCVRLVERVRSPRIRVLLDLYHAQVEEGNALQSILDYRDFIGYVHVADVPGRHEPGTGDVDYSSIARTLHEVGYEGVIGLEAFPLADDREALRGFREVFTSKSVRV
jgi:hydroxypyruvate isomerase